MDVSESAIPASEPLSSQVGGHAGVLATEDGSLIIKPALPVELKFYQTLQQSPELASLRPFTPKFIGTLRLEGKIDESKPAVEGGIIITPLDLPEKECIVLENLTHFFRKPNVLDVKLGTVLYDPSASPEKVERMLKTARNTTSLETGVRLTGFQVYNNITGEAVVTPKIYGKSLKAAQLPEGIAQFFPVNTPPEGDLSAKSIHGLPHSTLLPILHAIREEIAEIREVYASHEIRMVGGSLLIAYEADWIHAEEGVKLLVTDTEEEDEEIEGSDLEGDDEENPSPSCTVKLIDFAHTWLVPGEGPDEGVLMGLDTVLRLVDGRISQLS